MKNFLTEADFLPQLKSKGSITVTTDYDRPDKNIPFLNKVVMKKLSDDYLIEVEKVNGAYCYKVTEL